MSVMNGASGSSVLPAGRWSVDATRSSVAFAAGHMTLATVNGRFQEFDGALEIGSGTPRATGVVRAAAIDTDEPIRDEHPRRSRDFFDVERYPEITIRSTRIDYLDGGRLRVVGDLTMRGVTCEIALDARLGTRPEVVGDRRVELELRGELRRRDFGLTWNRALDAGGALLGNKVKDRARDLGGEERGGMSVLPEHPHRLASRNGTLAPTRSAVRPRAASR